MPKNLLLIFTRNPELGKCKTRLAATVGDTAALNIYTFLLKHTATITKEVSAIKQVWYSEEIWENDTWDSTYFEKRTQTKGDLGTRMQNAFEQGFAAGYEQIIGIGSDLYDINTQELNDAFKILSNNEAILGPAEDGGYYLLGLTTMISPVFKNKSWGTETVLTDTLKDLEAYQFELLPTKNDIDYYEDIDGIPAFDIFLKK